LNLPLSLNPGLARTIGTLMKLDFERAVLNRIPKIEENPGRYFRQVLFLCDEYQAFATVGESDPTGDEKFFSLSRQAKCIPIVATQSILISGGTATGKTTLLNALSALIPEAERLILIEDTAEIQIARPNLVRFEARRAQGTSLQSRSGTSFGRPCATGPTGSSSAKSAAARRSTCSRPSTQATRERSPPSMPTRPNILSTASPPACCKAVSSCLTARFAAPLPIQSICSCMSKGASPGGLSHNSSGSKTMTTQTHNTISKPFIRQTRNISPRDRPAPVSGLKMTTPDHAPDPGDRIDTTAAAEYIRANFEPEDRLAVLAINRKSGALVQRFGRPKRLKRRIHRGGLLI